jgi:hypothetical protein
MLTKSDILTNFRLTILVKQLSPINIIVMIRNQDRI